jgi:hypothetical protein
VTQRYCKVCEGWHDLDRPWPDNCRPEPIWARSDLPAPMLIGDNLDYVWNPADGKRYTSKKKYEREVKARGYEIAGNDTSVKTAHTKRVEPKSMPGLKEDLKRAWTEHTGDL